MIENILRHKLKYLGEIPFDIEIMKASQLLLAKAKELATGGIE